jgi:hypothetical protein
MPRIRDEMTSSHSDNDDGVTDSALLVASVAGIMDNNPFAYAAAVAANNRFCGFNSKSMNF